MYNFTCTLPPVLPSSFEGQYGYVRYTVKVTLDRPWKFDQETKMAFTVINAFDLNLNPSYKVRFYWNTDLFWSWIMSECHLGPTISELIIWSWVFVILYFSLTTCQSFSLTKVWHIFNIKYSISTNFSQRQVISVLHKILSVATCYF